ncbi:hypothetical protein MKW92_050129 [Papaver armeniacum]|nr:hypothetical protein MKW92_050129 [Papaver armeniacum]
MFGKVRLSLFCIYSIIICMLIFSTINQYSGVNFSKELVCNPHNPLSITQEPSSSQRKDANEIISYFEILVVVSPDHNQFSYDDNIYCLFQNNSTSPAKFTGCSIPENLRDLKSIHRQFLPYHRRLFLITEIIGLGDEKIEVSLNEDGLQDVVNKLMKPSPDMLTSLLPSNFSSLQSQKIGQLQIFCYEFGMYDQKVHSVEGVTQGYECRRRILNRHKSIVLLNTIDTSMFNVIHHFELKDGYNGRKVSSRYAVVNHYKYQAWSEFQAKFKRRVSAYVVDWKDPVNPMSKDHTPGLGFEPVEPKDWGFCEVQDTGLKMLTQKWFGLVSFEGLKMVWQEA